MATADIYDQFLMTSKEGLQVVSPGLRSFGGRSSYSGQIVTVTSHGDGSISLKNVLSQPGDGRVVVADAHGSSKWALLGDNLATLGLRNGWAGLVINGFVRDTALLRTIAFGVHALGTTPARPSHFDLGQENVIVRFHDVVFTPGTWLYADEDGILVCREPQAEHCPKMQE